MPLALPPAPPCVEADCDRLAAAGDRRCDLHSSRLGRLPRTDPVPVVAEPELVRDEVRIIDVPVGPDHFPWRIGVAAMATLTWAVHMGAMFLLPVSFTRDGGWLNGFALILAATAASLAGLYAWRAARTLSRRIAAGLAVVLSGVPWYLVVTELWIALS
jgi:hypothetical protein